MRKPLTIMAGSSVALLTTGCITLDLHGGPREMQERVVNDNGASDKVAVIDVVGTMTVDRSQPSGGFPFSGPSENIIGRTKEQLDRAAEDPDVRSVVVRISSPGGEVYPSLEIYRELVRFRQESGKPVVAYVPDVAASGGYLAAVGANEIVADVTAITGSIGVLLMVPELTGFMEWIHIKVHTFKAGDKKDIGNPFREMTDTDRAEIMKLGNYFHDKFKGYVDTGRSNLSAEQVEAIADGRVFTADEALENGLVDAIGDLRDAHERAAQRAGLSAATTNLVMYRRPGEYGNSVYTQVGGIQINLDAQALTPRPRYLFLWQPGLGS